MSRPCKACEGFGLAYRVQKDAIITMTSFLKCAACSGSGRVVESIPAADALADAAQLRATVMGVHGAHLVSASLMGSIAARKMLGSAPVILRKDVGVTAAEAARAAFRAVPGLRA